MNEGETRAEHIDRAFKAGGWGSAQATGQAITRLAEVRGLSQTTVGKRNRAFEAPEVIRTFTALERRDRLTS